MDFRNQRYRSFITLQQHFDHRRSQPLIVIISCTVNRETATGRQSPLPKRVKCRILLFQSYGTSVLAENGLLASCLLRSLEVIGTDTGRSAALLPVISDSY